MTTACHRLTVPLPVSNISPDLMQPCADLKLLTGNTGAHMTRWAIDTSYQYKDCQARHQGLIDAVGVQE